MKFERLEIKRSASYDTPPNTLQGCLELKGERGSQVIALSGVAISAIMTCIAAEVTATAKINAKATAGAMADAVAEPVMLTQFEITPEPL